MSLYFPTALAMASNNTDVYVGKSWTLMTEEQTSLGQFRITPMKNAAPPDRVLSDFAGVASYTFVGSPNWVNTTYNNSLRNYVVGTLGLQPDVTIGAQRPSYVECAYVQAVNSGNQAVIVSRNIFSNTWVTNTTFSSGPSVNYNVDLVLHVNAVGSPDDRFIFLSEFSARYSDAYPSSPGFGWTVATTYPDGFAKYAFANKLGVTTALGEDGRVRYTTDGINWAGTTISGGAGTTLTCAAWTQDGIACIAAGVGGVLATSADGQTFTLSTSLQSSAWGTRRAAAITADPGIGSVIIVVCADGTVAVSGDYGVTWAVATGLFTVRQQYGSLPIDQTPIKCWVRDNRVYVSIYGGQVVILPSVLSIGVDASNGFNGYFTTFGTPDITGMYVSPDAVPSAPVRAVFAGGNGRVKYMTTAGPMVMQTDLSLMSAIIGLGYTTATVTSVYYDATLDCTFIGFSGGRIAYVFNPLASTAWQIYTIAGGTDVVGFARVGGGGGTIIAVTENGLTAVAAYSPPTTLSWAVNSTLAGALGGYFAASVATDGFAHCVVAAENNRVARTADGSSWAVTPLLSPFTAGFNIPTVVYDPRAPTGFSTGLYMAFYRDTFNVYATVSTNGLSWTSPPALFGGGAIPVGAFTFGTPPITIGINAAGTGAITKTPSNPTLWGSSAGLAVHNPAFPIPSGQYYVFSPVAYTGGTVSAMDVGVAAGRYGRIWLSFII